eukprot:scaffold13969_cov83-Cylindrotheca_fusiformis.AAC.1
MEKAYDMVMEPVSEKITLPEPPLPEPFGAVTISDSEASMDCPICLEKITKADLLHPMQCKSQHCNFNFCMNCIESMVVASKDDFEESSDGNLHVKVYLHCPNCRSDLSGTIRDTLLLRKADFLLWNKHLADDELTPSQRRLKSVIHQEEVKRAIVTAREYESAFFEANDSRRFLLMEDLSSSMEDDDSTSAHDVDDDECGVEADLIQGVHQSFRLPKTYKLAEIDAQQRHEMIDKTLLRGLSDTMSKDEQRTITQLMTSGDTNKLAEAALILRDMEGNTRVPLRKRLIN